MAPFVVSSLPRQDARGRVYQNFMRMPTEMVRPGL